MMAAKHQFNLNDNKSQSGRILIIDDDRDILDSLKDIIELETSYEVKVASDIFSARQVADDFGPDIVMLDVQLGNTIGLSLIPPLKAQNPDVICIVMTAFRDAEYAATAVRNGADDYLFKPLDPENLLALLGGYLEKVYLINAKREAEYRYHAVFEQTYQMLLVMNVDGHILEANNTALEFGGWSSSVIIGKFLWDLPCVGSLETKEILMSMLCNVQQGKDIYQEMEFKGKNGTAYVEVTLKPILSAKGMAQFIVFEGHDITERKVAETEVRQLNTALEARVKERTVELEQAITLLKKENDQRILTEQFLRRAKNEAVQAYEFKSEFLGRVSHELRTPLNAILGFGQLLETEELSGDQAEYVGLMMKASNHLLALINELLDLSSIESGNIAVHINECEIMPLLKECVSLVQSLILDIGIAVTIESDQCKRGLIKADSGHTKEVIIHLLSNALKYNKKNGSIVLRCEQSSPRFLRISVTDTGPGLTEKQQHMIFEPFNRLGKEYSDIKGTGIGLSVCKKLIDLMNGQIGVDSQVGKGSTFWIEMPLAGLDNVK